MSALSDQIVATGKTYLGPVAEMFLNKQSKKYLNADLGALTKAQMKQFADHVKAEASKVMSPEKAAELAGKIAAM